MKYVCNAIQFISFLVISYALPDIFPIPIQTDYYRVLTLIKEKKLNFVSIYIVCCLKIIRLFIYLYLDCGSLCKYDMPRIYKYVEKGNGGVIFNLIYKTVVY